MHWHRHRPVVYSETQLRFRDMKVVDNGLISVVPSNTLAEHLNIAGDAQRQGDFARADQILQQLFATQAVSDLPVEMLRPLTLRTTDVLLDHEIFSIYDLVQCRLRDVRAWNNFGTVSRALLGDRMRTFGLNFSGQCDYSWINSLADSKIQRADRLLLLTTFREGVDKLDSDNEKLIGTLRQFTYSGSSNVFRVVNISLKLGRQLVKVEWDYGPWASRKMDTLTLEQVLACPVIKIEAR
jgi:hypothetical protein